MQSKVSFRPGSLVCITVAVATVIGCSRTDPNIVTTLATSNKWIVLGVGDLRAASNPFVTNILRFRAVREGAVYAEGPLYEIEGSGPTFRDKFPNTEWVGDSALHFWYPLKSVVKRDASLVVHNGGARSLKWLQLRYNELFLVLGLDPGHSVELPLFRWEPYVWISVDGEFEDGRPVPSETQSMRDASRRLQLTLTDATVSLLRH